MKNLCHCDQFHFKCSDGLGAPLHLLNLDSAISSGIMIFLPQDLGRNFLVM